ncbi:cysteine desulfurase [Apilactobacillus apinorum]|uniref:Cysteine desulfurase n=1 Tax=Apilactobacillus apinorum TaxID=1218495 RepID=A0ABP9ZG04_9LACO|nr:cysteine desulfurase [Apilactobacillus apinorum]KOY68649.1 uncharacterized protein RZ74_08580 [Apilactobacillus apinorum]CAI2681391.1 Putative uncharacterized protein [Apilactobacillus apinorum]
MAFEISNQLLGDNTVYAVSPEVKKYTLTDMGFVSTKAGNYSFERTLDPNDPYNGVKLKIVFKGDLSSFKLSAVTSNGLNKVNIFTNKQSDELVEQYNFLMNNFVERNVFIKK